MHNAQQIALLLHAQAAASLHGGSPAASESEWASAGSNNVQSAAATGAAADELTADASYGAAGLSPLPLPASVAASMPRACSPAMPARSAAGHGWQQPEEQQPQQLGTWAQRLFRLPLPQRGGAQAERSTDGGSTSGSRRTSSSGPAASSQAQAPASGASATRSIPAGQQPGRRGGGTTAGSAAAPAAVASEEALMQAAWRWRFARRWQAEQVRPVDPEAVGSVGDGDMEDALQYLAACGGDVGSTTSTDLLAGTDSANWDLRELSNTLGQSLMLAHEECSLQASRQGSSNGLEAVLGGYGAASRDSTVHGHHAAGAVLGRRRSGGAPPSGARPAAAAAPDGDSAEALRELRLRTRRAAEVLAHQANIERNVNERWAGIEAAAGRDGEAWVGGYLEAAVVDDWGRFEFVLARVGAARGRHKLLVRGSNSANQAKLLEAINRQVGCGCGRTRMALVGA
jgi:hypothetical protein